MQENLLIYDRRRLHLWKASKISRLDRQTGPYAGSASHIFWRRRARQAPKCIALGADALSVEAFTDRVMLSGSSLKFYINRGLQLIWSTEARRDMRMEVTESTMESSSVSMILNPCWVRSCIYPR